MRVFMTISFVKLLSRSGYPATERHRGGVTTAVRSGLWSGLVRICRNDGQMDRKRSVGAAL
ncbi:hypothetical protein GCM10023160_04770 [Brachybacterium paraconglomeratum]